MHSFSSQILTPFVEFSMFLIWFCLFSSLWVCDSCPNLFTKPFPLLPSMPPSDHFFHVTGKTVVREDYSCLQSQRTVFTLNKVTPSFFPLPRNLCFLSSSGLLTLLFCIRLSLGAGCSGPGQLRCTFHEAPETHF